MKDYKMKQVYEALQWASSFLKKHGREENVVYIAMGYVMGMDRAQLLAHLRKEISSDEWRSFKNLILKHANGEPIQYLIGYEEFYGRKFLVNPNVLIPRPETEELVYGILERVKKRFNVTYKKEHVEVEVSRPYLDCVDIGTGSGAIAITLKLEMPELQVTATDISKGALTVAWDNAKRLGAEIRFVEGDLLTPFIGKKRFDVIVSNPPYIPLTDRKDLSEVVKDHEPASALFGGLDGLELYRKMIRQLPKVMKQQALIGFEIGVGQGNDVANLLKEQFPLADIEVVQDINGKERMVFAFVE